MSELNPPQKRPGFLAAILSDRGWWAVTAAFAFNGLLFGAWAARVPAFKETFHLSPAALGVLLLALAAGAILSFPMAGVLSERQGCDRVTIACACAYGPALICLALAPNALTLGIALFVFGALHGAMDVAMNSWAARVERELQRSTMSIFHAMFSLGAGLGAASGYVAVQVGAGVLLHFALIAMLGGVAALVLMIPAAEPQPAHDGDAPKVRVALPSGALLLVGLIAFSVAMGEGAMADWSAVFLRDILNATEAQAALGYAVFSALMVLARLFGAALVQRIGPVATTRASGLMAAAGLLIVIFANGLAVALLGFAALGVGYAVVMPLVFSRAANDPAMRPGPAIASVATLGYGGLLLGPPIVGFVAQIAGLPVSFGLLAVLSLLPVLLAPALHVEGAVSPDPARRRTAAPSAR